MRLRPEDRVHPQSIRSQIPLSNKNPQHVSTITQTAFGSHFQTNHTEQPIQSPKRMAPGLLEAPSQASIQARTQVSPEIEAQVGTTTMDKVRQADSVGELYLFVHITLSASVNQS